MFGKKSPKPESKKANAKANQENEAEKSTENGEAKSVSLNGFRETIKDVLEDMTSLQVNTIILSHISTEKFDARDFHEKIFSHAYNCEEGLQDIKKSLLARNNELKQRKEAISDQERDNYNRDLEIYKNKESQFYNPKDPSDPNDPNHLARLIKSREYYTNPEIQAVAKQVLKIDLPKDKEGKIIPDAVTIRLFRRLWETEQTIVNGDRIYAQTRIEMDGDLTNRFVEDLFTGGKGRFDPKMVEIIFRLHHQAVENAESQWSKLIDTCIGLIQSLAQRK
jgi:hypothetical protein